MVKKIELQAEKREAGKKALRAARQETFIPAILYGQGGEAESLMIKKNDFVRAFEKAGESSLIDLQVKGSEPLKAIIKDVQKNPMTNNIMHVDLYRIDMKQEIETEIPIHFEGQSFAEHQLGGTLVKNMETIHIKCLPSDLVEFYSVDLSKLKDFGDMIRVSDINIEKGVEILSSTDSVIVTVSAPKVEDERPVAAAVAPEKADEKEVKTENKKE